MEEDREGNGETENKENCGISTIEIGYLGNLFLVWKAAQNDNYLSSHNNYTKDINFLLFSVNPLKNVNHKLGSRIAKIDRLGRTLYQSITDTLN